ncbi:hypothetical protein GCM10009624_26240 [Gordonia sinesedis]
MHPRRAVVAPASKEREGCPAVAPTDSAAAEPGSGTLDEALTVAGRRTLTQAAEP